MYSGKKSRFILGIAGGSGSGKPDTTGKPGGAGVNGAGVNGNGR